MNFPPDSVLYPGGPSIQEPLCNMSHEAAAELRTLCWHGAGVKLLPGMGSPAPLAHPYLWLAHAASGAVLPLEPWTLCGHVLSRAIELNDRFQCPAAVHTNN